MLLSALDGHAPVSAENLISRKRRDRFCGMHNGGFIYMTTFNNAEVLARMNRALSGEGAGDEQAELPVQAYAWRMLRWEADIPMSDWAARTAAYFY